VDVEIKGREKTDGEERKAAFQLHPPKLGKSAFRLEFRGVDMINVEGIDIPSP
jgi:hypothetical protein